ncbi:unnamed protein product [Cyberlindnera jadinii]|uniref:Protein arginine methyltransferase NDUFAF7 n=1 Tax=Cyberlindnera jadinii (strain ATCC 18201 / CBS 1600 / BCRC 20928 / JCM 3617 / NBRC 0987 / NRRL Y-1542) TaxID=983966 RepID=A0A0H5C096_CYBJN|nr:unnamed protein product [Cyberlindnera jadinii]
MSLLLLNIPRALGRRCVSPKRFNSSLVPKKNELQELITKVIGFTGPLPLSQFMRQCLTHPTLGYYTSRDPLGAQGDFVTSPEISQMFGELIGVWFYSVWNQQRCPSNVNMVEFGPGRGTLMYDVMSSFTKLVKRRHGDDSLSLNLIMVEASHVLRQKQASILGDSDVDATGEYWKGKSRFGLDSSITWVDTERDVYEVIDMKRDTNFIIAHEFFDALPINQYQKTEEGWREILVDVHPDTKEFVLVKQAKHTSACAIPESQERYNNVSLNTTVEISPESYQYSKVIADLISINSRGTGAALIVDYGTLNEVPENTLRGIKDHKFTSPFKDLGEVDLSVDVDFQAIAHAARDSHEVEILGPIEQGDFLHNMGITHRVKQLCKRAHDEATEHNIEKAYHRLVDKDSEGMGKIYKFMGILPKGYTTSMGFNQ